MNLFSSSQFKVQTPSSPPISQESPATNMLRQNLPQRQDSDQEEDDGEWDDGKLNFLLVISIKQIHRFPLFSDHLIF